MYHIFKLENEPLKVESFISKLKISKEFSETFEGEIANGRINGTRANMLLIGGKSIGYVTTKGRYDVSNGNLQLVIKPSNTYWIVILLLLVLSAIAYSFDKSIGLLLISIGVTITFTYLFESNKFLKLIKRTSTVKGENTLSNKNAK